MVENSNTNFLWKSIQRSQLVTRPISKVTLLCSRTERCTESVSKTRLLDGSGTIGVYVSSVHPRVSGNQNNGSDSGKLKETRVRGETTRYCRRDGIGHTRESTGVLSFLVRSTDSSHTRVNTRFRVVFNKVN